MAAIDEICSIAAPLLGWDAARTDHEKANYRARVEAELAAQLEPTDQLAAAVRAQASDIVPTDLA